MCEESLWQGKGLKVRGNRAWTLRRQNCCVHLSAVRGLSGDAILLVLGGMPWWACHYTLLWNPAIARAYSLAGGYGLRFLATLA